MVAQAELAQAKVGKGEKPVRVFFLRDLERAYRERLVRKLKEKRQQAPPPPSAPPAASGEPEPALPDLETVKSE